jgi:antitoxin component of RelBE/YafQ-DinJ toxin-antitoxin module
MRHICAKAIKAEKHSSHPRHGGTKSGSRRRRRENTSVKTVMRLRIQQDREEQVEEILHDLGLYSDQVVNVLLAQIVARRGVPFRIGLPKDSDVAVPIHHVAKIWSTLDDTDYPYLNDSAATGGVSR